MLRIALSAVTVVLLLAPQAQAQGKGTPEKLPPVEAGVIHEDGPMDPLDEGAVERVAALGYTTQWITAYRQQKNLLGTILWRYNSRWTWTYGEYGIIRAADHWEWGDHTTLGWRYAWSRYLEGYGALNTSYIGRTTQGRFDLAPGGTFIRSRYIRLRVIVYGSGRVSSDCLH